MGDVLTLIEKAQSLNTHYADQYGSEKDWNKLSGFLKGSNISAADFGEVLSVLNERIGEEEQAELEHIRWCRYMFLPFVFMIGLLISILSSASCFADELYVFKVLYSGDSNKWKKQR